MKFKGASWSVSPTMTESVVVGARKFVSVETNSKVLPKSAPPSSVPQINAPFASVSIVSHETSVSIRAPPPVILSPPANVDVADDPEATKFKAVSCPVVVSSASFLKNESSMKELEIDDVAERTPEIACTTPSERPESVMVPLEVSAVSPERAPPEEISQFEVLKVMVSPPSPMVRAPVVVSVPEMLFDPMVPPEMVSAPSPLYG